MFDYKESFGNISFYTIAFTLRSGSNLLCDYLAANGIGQPTEYFQYPFGVANKYYYELVGASPDDFKSFLARLVAQRSPNNIFGVKMTWDHKNALLEELGKHFGVQDIGDIFPNNLWIYLRRHDKIAQAVSLWRAIKSGKWTSQDPLTGPMEPEYDFFRILSLFFTLLTEEYLWDHYFGLYRIKPVVVYYEELVKSPVRVVFDLIKTIQALAGVEIVKDEADVKLVANLAVQRDLYSADIKSRFLSDLYHLGAHDYWSSRAAQLEKWCEFFSRESWRV